MKIHPYLQAEIAKYEWTDKEVFSLMRKIEKTDDLEEAQGLVERLNAAVNRCEKERRGKGREAIAEIR